MKVLISGTANGIGLAIKDVYLKNGHEVYGVDLYKQDEANNFHPYIADITNKEQLDVISEHFLKSNVEFDVIINVAGIHKMSSFVEGDFSNIKKVIDVNLIGTIGFNFVFHKHLKNKGKITIITSEVANMDPMPFNGLYNVSKTGLDCYAQSLRQELNLLDQKVVTFRPGSIETKLSANSIPDTEKLANETILYQKEGKKFANIVKKFIGKPLPANKLASKIYKVSLKNNPKYIYKVHRSAGLVLLNLLPKRLQCFIIKMLLK
ncbi:MAG: SDR family NAD(P)-dependent oxidoreductase [Bacilli bacterium]